MATSRKMGRKLLAIIAVSQEAQTSREEAREPLSTIREGLNNSFSA